MRWKDGTIVTATTYSASSEADCECPLYYYDQIEKEGIRMKEYETVWEIFNECANNQMRDVFIDEICTDDPEKFVLDKFKGKEVSCEKSVLPDGSIVFDIMASGIRQRYTFTEI